MSNEGPNADAEEIDEHQAVGARLRDAREVLGLTQQDVADAVRIPRTSIIALEAGKRKVTALELRGLARLYRRSVAWLLGEEADPSPTGDALYHAAEALSDADKAQVLRFAQFLAAADPAGAKPATAPRKTTNVQE